MNMLSLKSAVVFGLFLCLVSPSIRSQDEEDYPPTPEGIRRFLDEEYPEAPDDLVRRYIDAVKKSSRYGLLRAAEAEPVRSMVAERLEPTGLEFSVDEARSLDLFAGNFFGRIYLARSNTIGLPDGTEVRLWLLYDSAQDQSYRITPSRLREIDFRYAREIFIRDPFHAVLDRFTATDSALGEVVKELAEMGDADLVLREGDPRVTLDVRNRSISQCLELATSIADYQLFLTPENVSGRRLDVRGVLEEHGQPAFLRELLGKEEAPESPLDTLGEAVSRAAQQVKERRPIIQVKPPARKEER